jgi:predicted NAD/FAD-binding protein
MLAEIKRFHRAASRLLRDSGPDDHETLEAFLNRHRFSWYFVDYFITPLVAAVWSCAGADALRYPARYLFVFLDHHGMLSVFGSPTWRTVTGGSANYVQAIASRLDEVSLGTPVHSLRRMPDGVLIQASSSAPRLFDAAVVAVHPDQALLLLDDPTPSERAVRGAIPYSTNRARVHTDSSVLPRHPRARASWNYLVKPGGDRVVVSYDISRLMRINSRRRFVVTLGGDDRVDPASVIAEMTYSHPLYTPESVAAQRLLPMLDDDLVVFAGAYHGWGFHEDGAASGLRAATMPHHRMLATRNTRTWIQKYIFPGGLLPSTRAIADITERQTVLRTVDLTSLRPHYAETLRLWRERFTQRREALAHLGFDEVFGRMWELYLAYSEAGFRSGYLDVYQWTFARGDTQ